MHIRSRQPNDKSFSLHGDAEVSQVNILAFAGFETMYDGILFLRMSSPTVWIFRDDEAQLFNESHIEMAVFYRLTK